jgi:exonuclease III
MPMYFPTIIMGDFNIDMLDQNSTHLNKLGNFMKHYSMELQFKEITTIYGTHIDHIWTNAPTRQCMLGIIEAHWIDHKPIYFPFKWLDYVPQYHYIS